MLDQTDESIARAKADCQTERRQIEAKTGLRIADDGTIRIRPYVIGCPVYGCRFTASALIERRAVRSLCAHIVRAHQKKES